MIIINWQSGFCSSVSFDNFKCFSSLYHYTLVFMSIPKKKLIFQSGLFPLSLFYKECTDINEQQYDLYPAVKSVNKYYYCCYWPLLLLFLGSFCAVLIFVINSQLIKMYWFKSPKKRDYFTYIFKPNQKIINIMKYSWKQKWIFLFKNKQKNIYSVDKHILIKGVRF